MTGGRSGIKRALVLSGGGGRGAYEAGVWWALSKAGIRFQILAGTSVGSINAALIAQGMHASGIRDLWLSIRNKDIYRFSLWRNIAGWFRPTLTSVFDTSPLLKLLERFLDTDAISNSKYDLLVTAVDTSTGHKVVFPRETITARHILASCAIPLAFPVVTIAGHHFWDGGLISNTPILPALDAGATELYIVMLNPINGISQSLPRNRLQGIERIHDILMSGSFRETFSALHASRTNESEWRCLYRGIRRRFIIIEPQSSLGLIPILNFDPEVSAQLIRLGREDTERVIQQTSARPWKPVARKASTR